MTNVHWKINVLHITREKALEAKENAHYDKVLKAEAIGIMALIVALVAFELAF